MGKEENLQLSRVEQKKVWPDNLTGAGREIILSVEDNFISAELPNGILSKRSTFLKPIFS